MKPPSGLYLTKKTSLSILLQSFQTKQTRSDFHLVHSARGVPFGAQNSTVASARGKWKVLTLIPENNRLPVILHPEHANFIYYK